MKKEIVIGGAGLSGLSLAILLAQKNWKVTVIEKGDFPKHKVCGEYLSMESWDFLKKLDLDLEKFVLPFIDQFELWDHKQKIAEAKLPLRGVGISRYLLDDLLYQKAKSLGVDFQLNNRILSVEYSNDFYIVKCKKNEIQTTIYVSATGKEKDISHPLKSGSDKNEYIAVKYHLKTQIQIPASVALHLFPGGYAGFSEIEQNKYCFCYLLKMNAFKKYQNIKKWEQEVLFRSDYLKNIFDNAEIIEGFPLSISNFRFSNRKDPAFIKIGDALDMMPPVFGNGMSLAFRMANILCQSLEKDFTTKDAVMQDFNKILRTQVAYRYPFAKALQNILNNSVAQSFLLTVLRIFPILLRLFIPFSYGKKID